MNPSQPIAVRPAPRGYEILPLRERTAAWWAWRRQGIGSADAATILGALRGRTVERLLEEKWRPSAPSARHFEQARSATRERQARALYCATIGVTVAPACVQSLERPWQRASLDGLSADGTRAVEIKCGAATYASATARGRPPAEHMPQLQHILAVTGLPAIDYWCCVPRRSPLRLEVRRDEAFITRLLAAEEAFWSRLAVGWRDSPPAVAG